MPRSKNKIFLIILIFVFLFLPNFSQALVDLSINVSDITFSRLEAIEGDRVRIFARVFNLGEKDVYGFVDSFSFWTYSDIFMEHGPVLSREFPGIYGMLNVHGLPKASYNAFLMLKMMGDQRREVKFTRTDIPEMEAWATAQKKDGTVI